MTHLESNEVFDQVNKALIEQGFTSKEGYDKRYLFKGDYMAFNCTHMCSSLRMFKLGSGGTRRLVVDIRTSFVHPLETNKRLAEDFINQVIQKLNEEDNTVSNPSVQQ